MVYHWSKPVYHPTHWYLANEENSTLRIPGVNASELMPINLVADYFDPVENEASIPS
jgi:hypothetical protein